MSTVCREKMGRDLRIVGGKNKILKGGREHRYYSSLSNYGGTLYYYYKVTSKCNSISKNLTYLRGGEKSPPHVTVVECKKGSEIR